MSLKNPVTPSGIDPGSVRLVAQRLNHCATLGPDLLLYKSEIHLFLGLEVTLLSHVHVHFTNHMLPEEETYIKVTLIQINYNGILRTFGYIIKAVCIVLYVL